MATEVVKIVDPDNGAGTDYTSLSAWEAGEQKDLVTADEIAIADCRCTSGSADTTAVTIDGWTTSDTNYIKIYTTQANRHDGKWNNNKYRLIALNPLSVYVFYTQIIGLQIGVDTTSTYSGQAIRSDYNKNKYQLYDSLIIRKYAGANIAYTAFKLDDFSTDTVIRNTVIYGFDATAYGAIGVSTDNSSNYLTIQNVTIYDCGKGIKRGNGSYTKLQNVISYENTTDFDINGGSWHADSDYNFSKDDTAPGAHSIHGTTDGKTPDFVNTGAETEDFHLQSTSDAIDVGTDLSGTFSDDIDGDTRSGTWDIGADEYVSGGGETFYKSLEGALPYPSGVVTHTFTAVKTLSGEMPAPAGNSLKKISKSLVGEMPASTGATVKKVGKSLAGAFPSPFGVVSSTVAYVKSLVGNFPAASASLSAKVVTCLSVAGEMPAAVGIITKKVGKKLIGDFPSAIGSLTKKMMATLTGNFPSPTGDINLGVKKNLAGIMGTISGVVSMVLNPVVVPISKVCKLVGSSFKKFIG